MTSFEVQEVSKTDDEMISKDVLQISQIYPSVYLRGDVVIGDIRENACREMDEAAVGLYSGRLLAYFCLRWLSAHGC